MKRENMKVGMKVVVKPNAIGLAALSMGKVVSIERIDRDGDGYIDGDIIVYPKEVRKATQEEILSSMTTQELQQLLDEIDTELDKRLAAVHPDAKYMFRECVVDGYTCYVMGVDDDRTILIQSHRKGMHSGGGFFGEWAGRNDMTWELKRDVKLVNEDGSWEDVL